MLAEYTLSCDGDWSLSLTLEIDLQNIVLELGDILLRTDLTDEQRSRIENIKTDVEELEEEI